MNGQVLASDSLPLALIMVDLGKSTCTASTRLSGSQQSTHVRESLSYHFSSNLKVTIQIVVCVAQGFGVDDQQRHNEMHVAARQDNVP